MVVAEALESEGAGSPRPAEDTTEVIAEEDVEEDVEASGEVKDDAAPVDDLAVPESESREYRSPELPIPLLLRTPILGSPHNGHGADEAEAALSEPSASDEDEDMEQEEPTPTLPDPYEAPPDATSITPSVPLHIALPDEQPTPSLVVEPPAEAPTLPTVIPVDSTREETPVRFPKPDEELPEAPIPLEADLVPLMADRASSLSPSVVAQPPGTAEELEMAAETSASAEVDDEIPEQSNVTQPEDNKAEESASVEPTIQAPVEEPVEAPVQEQQPWEATPTEEPAEATPQPTPDEVPQGRLRHLHSGLGGSTIFQEPQRPAPRAHSPSRPSLPPAEPPVTRSHCFYRKLHLFDHGLSATVLVPQCTTFEVEKLEEERSEDRGEATAEEENKASAFAMTDETPRVHPRLVHKLHRIVGSSIFDEGHCFLLEADENSLTESVGPFAQPIKADEVAAGEGPAAEDSARPQARASVQSAQDAGPEGGEPKVETPAATPKRRGRRSRLPVEAEEATEAAPEEGEMETPARSTRKSKKTPASRLEPPAETLSPLQSPRRLSRRATRSTSRVTDEASVQGEPAEDTDTPARNTRSHARAVSDAGTAEREGTPVAITVSTEPTKSQSPTKARRTPRGSHARISSTSKEPSPPLSPMKRKAPASPAKRVTRRSLAAAREDDPYRPDEEDMGEGSEGSASAVVSEAEAEVETKSASRRRSKAKAAKLPSSATVPDEADEAHETSTAGPATAPTAEPAEDVEKEAGATTNVTSADDTPARNTRRATRRSLATAADEAPYRPNPEDEASSELSEALEAQAEQATEGKSISQEPEVAEPAPSSPATPAKTTRKRKARLSTSPVKRSVPVDEVNIDVDVAPAPDVEEEWNGIQTRSAKRRALGEKDKPVLPSTVEEGSGVEVKVQTQTEDKPEVEAEAEAEQSRSSRKRSWWPFGKR